MKRGITTLEIILIVVVLLVIAAIAIPNLMETKKAASVAAFIAHLRTVSSAQEQYKSDYGVYGTLLQLHQAGLIDSDLANATSADSAKSGYYFIMSVDGANSWSCLARPSKWGITGERNAKVGTGGVIYLNEVENSSEFAKKLGE